MTLHAGVIEPIRLLYDNIESGFTGKTGKQYTLETQSITVLHSRDMSGNGKVLLNNS